jgi:type IV pilus assembly protein PilV
VRARPATGFTLIEVLVALFVLASGVLGAVATQMKAQATRHQSALLSGAVQLATSLAERMRANAVAMSAADTANPYLQLDYDSAAGPPAAPAATCHGDAVCAPAAMAAFDLFEASRVLHDGFPGARIRVCRDLAGWDAGSGSLSWDCKGGPGSPIVIKVGWRPTAQAGVRAPFAPAVAIIASARTP